VLKIPTGQAPEIIGSFHETPPAKVSECEKVRTHRAAQHQCEPRGRLLERHPRNRRDPECVAIRSLATIDSDRQHGNLSSAIRLFVLDYYLAQVNGGTPASTKKAPPPWG
jgi:hypothetical protein